MPKPRFFTLRTRLILAIVPLILVFMAFNFLVILHHEQENLERETRLRASSLAAGLSILSAEAMLTFSEYLLDQNTDRFGRLPDVVYAMVLDPDGKVLASTLPGERGKRYDDPVTRTALQSATESFAYSDFEGQKVLDTSYPIQLDNRRLGTVRIGLSLRPLQQALALSRRYLTGLTLVLLAGALAFTGILTRYSTEPLLALAGVARDLARGNLDARAPAGRRDEVGLLGAALNHMAGRLHQMIEQEKQARQRLQRRVQNLVAFTDRVMAGDLTGQAPVEEDDDLGLLTMSLNEMVRHLRALLEEERATRTDLERSKRELEVLNEKLKELDRLKSDFLNTVSHELRTPLTSIKAFAEILLDQGAEDPETQAEFLGIINKESDRLTRLINNLLDLSRIEAGKMQWDFQPLNLEEIVRTAAASMRAAAEKKGLDYQVEAEEGLPVQGDADRLIQVIHNLVGNAIKFTPSGGRVRITARRVDGQAEVAVEDNGMGIDRAYHQVIFEKFGRVDTSETREIKGSGLGLSIAHSIVEAHGGTLTVHSELNQGSCFEVRLPLRQEPAPLARGAAPWQAEKPRGKRILVVDDEANIRRFLRHLLEQEGYDVREAHSGQEALDMVPVFRPDLVTLDIRLPDMDGFEVLGRIKGLPGAEQVRVVILSIVEDRERGYQLGAVDYLTKPVDRDRLLERIESLLSGSGREILVVDDDPSTVRALEAVFRYRGYSVRGAGSGEQALAEVERHQPDLLILDLRMPGLSGHDVIRRLKEDQGTADIPILVLTGSAGPEEQSQALGMGARSVITKPFSENQITSLVREILRDGARPEEEKDGPAAESPPPGGGS
jgi:signal transduction histidine kinase/DNA-binding response OmpR family regulator